MENEKQVLYILSFILVIIFLILGFFWIKQPARNFTKEDIKYVKIAGQNIKVDLALTEEQQSQGLSGKSGLDEAKGMLFIFDKPGIYPFWMKDMNFPIDMIWIAGEDFRDLRVVYIKKNALPELYPETYNPDKDAQYVLEVNAGFSEKNKLREGDRVLFINTL